MRLFIAVSIPDFIKDRIAETLAREFPLRPKGQWVPASRWHVTVKFLGETLDPLVPRLLEQVRAVAEKTAPFSLSLGGWGRFPSHPPIRVLWLGTESGADSLRALSGVLDERLLSLGFAREDRPYVPHLTVARFEESLNFLTARDPALGRGGETFQVESLEVFESPRDARETAYPLLARYSLGATK